MRRMSMVVACAGVAGIACLAQGQVIASEDFDGGAIGLLSSSVPALDGGPGDYFGVGDLATWPQGFPPGVPFSLTDDSLIDIAGGTRTTGNAFSADNEGIFGQARGVNDAFFAISDSDEFGAGQTASWSFDISGATQLGLSIDLGGISSDSFGGFGAGTFINFEVSIDGGTSVLALSINQVAAGTGGFITRLMDLGTASGGGALLEASGVNGVVKTLADTGLPAGNLFLDKTPASGAGAGLMDTFSTAISGTGSVLTITMTADLAFEGAAFDNIVITGIPAPASIALLGLGGLVATRRRR